MTSTPRPIKFDDLLRMNRVGGPVVGPRGHVVFTATRPDRDKNRNQTDLYMVPPEGGEPVQLTHSGSANRDPAFAPDGIQLAFASNRSGSMQIWVMPLDGGEARRVGDFPLGARQPVWFPDGKSLLAAVTVYPDLSDLEAMKSREEDRKKAGATPRIIDDLMFRHWDSWTEDQAEHVFRIDLESGEGKDLTPGPYPAPPRALSGAPEYAVSPDGKEVCFVSLRDPAQAVSTNINLWTIPAEGGEPKRVSPWPGCNLFPAYSPQGDKLAFAGMRRAGYEADRTELLILDRASGDLLEVCPDFDRSVGPVFWDPQGKWLYFSAEDKGTHRIYRVAATGGEPEALTEGFTDHVPGVGEDGAVYFARESFVSPPELMLCRADTKSVEPQTEFNADVLGELRMHDGEDFWYEGAQGEQVHGYVVKPPQFEAGKRYPVVFLIHGGPQGAFSRDFHERWNAQMFASRGLVAVLINPRGSTGYGQAFTDAIRGQWGGDCYQDLMRGFDYVLEHYDFCDPERTAAAGASFGGFMVNWIASQTDRFKCLVCHDGIFNTEMMNWLTEELWFTEWEFEGLPWESPKAYRQYSPHTQVQNVNTPMLVIHGEQDFRCVTAEGLGLFTALQRQGVPSRLLYFPDEGHWVLKPKNRQVWYKTVLDWLDEYLKGD